MKILKTIINVIIEPIRYLSGRGALQKLVEYSENHRWFLIVLTTLTTILVLFLVYVLPILMN